MAELCGAGTGPYSRPRQRTPAMVSPGEPSSKPSSDIPQGGSGYRQPPAALFKAPAVALTAVRRPVPGTLASHGGGPPAVTGPPGPATGAGYSTRSCSGTAP